MPVVEKELESTSTYDFCTVSCGKLEDESEST
jgi:hypothetical protein